MTVRGFNREATMTTRDGRVIDAIMFHRTVFRVVSVKAIDGKRYRITAPEGAEVTPKMARGEV